MVCIAITKLYFAISSMGAQAAVATVRTATSFMLPNTMNSNDITRTVIAQHLSSAHMEVALANDGPVTLVIDVADGKVR